MSYFEVAPPEVWPADAAVPDSFCRKGRKGYLVGEVAPTCPGHDPLPLYIPSFFFFSLSLPSPSSGLLMQSRLDFKLLICLHLLSAGMGL